MKNFLLLSFIVTATSLDLALQNNTPNSLYLDKCESIGNWTTQPGDVSSMNTTTFSIQPMHGFTSGQCYYTTQQYIIYLSWYSKESQSFVLIVPPEVGTGYVRPVDETITYIVQA